MRNLNYWIAPDLDNLSLLVTGTHNIPDMIGKIAYFENNDKYEPHAINILDPNTRQAKTIWTHPGTIVYGPREIAWRPDASEIAFSSDHEMQSSVLEADIYAITPYGEQMRKITGPSQAAIENSDLPRVIVKGKLVGGAGSYSSVTLTIQGVKDFRHVYVSDGGSASFTFDNVPVLGDSKEFNQPITMRFSNPLCSNGSDLHVPIAPVHNGIVDLGTIRFLGYNCLGAYGSGWLVARDLNWKHDGSEIGFHLTTGFDRVSSSFSKFPNVFESESIKPSGSLESNSFTWSPVDDRYLFCDRKDMLSAEKQLYIAQEGGDPRELVNNNNGHIQPAWLPDGSGFVYIGQPFGQAIDIFEDLQLGEDDNIFYYDLKSDQIQRLTYFRYEMIKNLSISSNGQYIIFEMHDLPYKTDLWIMDRLNPVDMWRVTDSGNCTAPHWSPKAVPTSEKINENQDNSNTDSNSNNGGSGGGGCFISSCFGL